MKSEAVRGAHQAITPLPLVAPRWTTAIPAIEPIGDDAVRSRRESATDVAARLQINALRDLAARTPKRDAQPTAEEQSRTAADHPTEVAEQAKPSRREDDSPTTAFHGVDVSLLPDQQFFAMTKALSRASAQTPPSQPEFQPFEEAA